MFRKITSISLLFISIVFLPFQAFAQGDDTSLTLAEKKAIISEVAIENNIPPEILKAIAMRESKFQQFDENGDAGSATTGIGIMQITPFGDQNDTYQIERLKNDIHYNVEMGAKTLLDKWDSRWFPQVNDGDWRVLEDWYFAILGYNGHTRRNDPSYTPDDPTYQEQVYERIENFGLIPPLTFGDFKVGYNSENNPDIMFFPQDKVVWEGANTFSKELFRVNDAITPASKWGYVNLRDAIDGQVVQKIPENTQLKIIEGPFEINDLHKNYVYYHVKGENVDGYVASPYIDFVDYNSNQNYVSMKDSTQVVDATKVWNIKFNTAMDAKTILNQTIYVENAQGEKVRTTLMLSDDGKTVQVKPPHNGYQAGKTYTLYIQKDLTSMKNKGLKEPKKLVFYVK